MVSAHFCVERDGRIYQFADTNDMTFGTGWCTEGWPSARGRYAAASTIAMPMPPPMHWVASA